MVFVWVLGLWCCSWLLYNLKQLFYVCPSIVCRCSHCVLGICVGSWFVVLFLAAVQSKTVILLLSLYCLLLLPMCVVYVWVLGLWCCSWLLYNLKQLFCCCSSSVCCCSHCVCRIRIVSWFVVLFLAAVQSRQLFCCCPSIICCCSNFVCGICVGFWFVVLFLAAVQSKAVILLLFIYCLLLLPMCVVFVWVLGLWCGSWSPFKLKTIFLRNRESVALLYS